MTDIMIEDKVCWKCGNEFNDKRKRTLHHALPQFMKPKHNVRMPICEECHDIITSMDMGAMTSFASKLQKEALELQKKVAKLTSMLEVK